MKAMRVKLQGTATKKSDAFSLICYAVNSVNKLVKMHQIFWLLYLAALWYKKLTSLLKLYNEGSSRSSVFLCLHHPHNKEYDKIMET